MLHSCALPPTTAPVGKSSLLPFRIPLSPIVGINLSPCNYGTHIVYYRQTFKRSWSSLASLSKLSEQNKEPFLQAKNNCARNAIGGAKGWYFWNLFKFIHKSTEDISSGPRMFLEWLLSARQRKSAPKSLACYSDSTLVLFLLHNRYWGKPQFPFSLTPANKHLTKNQTGKHVISLYETNNECEIFVGV